MSEPLALPVIVDREPAERSEGDGALVPVLADAKDGAVAFLRSGERTWRVSWEAEASGKRRALPAGRYGLVGYRVVREDAHGARWFLSVAAPRPLRTVTVEAGATTELELSPVVNAKPFRAGRRVGVMITGENRGGLTLYKGRPTHLPRLSPRRW